jgi:hypothetical protein
VGSDAITYRRRNSSQAGSWWPSGRLGNLCNSSELILLEALPLIESPKIDQCGSVRGFNEERSRGIGRRVFATTRLCALGASPRSVSPRAII